MIIAASFDVNNPEMWNNRALQYGDGLFETMRFHHKTIPLWDLHQKRLFNGLLALGMDVPDLTAINQVILKHINNMDGSEYKVKLTMFRCHQTSGYQAKIQAVDWFVTLDELPQSSACNSLVLAVANYQLSQQPRLAGHKHLNRLEQVLIANELNHIAEVDDLLVLDQSMHVVETTYQNVIFIKDNELITPELNCCGVNGVGLNWLSENFKVYVRPIHINDVPQYDAMMVGNSLRGFRLVSRIISIDSFVTSHPVHDKIVTRWNQMFN